MGKVSRTSRRKNAKKYSIVGSKDQTELQSIEAKQLKTKNDTIKPISKQIQSLISEKWQQLPLSKKQLSSFILIPIMLTAILLNFHQLRWSLALLIYMPTLSGLYFQFESYLGPMHHAYLEWELNTFPHLFESTPLPEISADEYTYEKFLQVSDNMKKFVVIRGVWNTSKAVQTWGKDEWLESLEHKDFEIESVEEDDNAVKYDYNLRSEPWSEFVAAIKRREFRYSWGLDEIYSAFPNLIDDVELERLGRESSIPGDYNFCQSLNILIGGTGIGLRWHNANHANFGVMIQGEKDFHLLDGQYSTFMGPDANLDPFSTGFAHRSPNDIVDRLPIKHVTIKAGDAIFLPVWGWHSVETRADPNTGFAMLNPCRFGAIQSSVSINPVLELYRHTGFINWLHPKIPIIARFIPFFRVLQDGIRELTNTMPHWKSDDCYSSKRDACETYFKSVGWPLKYDKRAK